MTNLVFDLLVLLLVLMSTGIVLYGWGILTWRYLGMSSPKNLSSLTIWLGFCVVLSVIEFIHLFVAINWMVTVALLVVGMSAFSYQRRSYTQSFLKTIWVAIKKNPWCALILTSMIILWCLRAMGTPNNYDSGLYHFQSIRWLNEEPIVLGLGNLHWRLALNQAHFGFLALLNFAPYWNKAYAAGGLFLLVLTLLTIYQVAQKQSARWKYSIGLVLFLSMGFVAASIVNPSPDNAVTLLEIVLFIYLLNLAQSVAKGGKGEHQDLNFDHCAIVIQFLCVAVVLTKFSSIGFALGSVFCLTLLLIITKTMTRVMSVRMIGMLTLLSCVHFLRGYLLSGAPLFPSTILGLWDLPWAVSKNVAVAETELIFSWARRPGLEFATRGALTEEWFYPWLRALSPMFKWLFTLSILLTLINLVRLLKGEKTITAKLSTGGGVEYLLYLPILSGLLFWFLTAPDVRFLGALVCLFFALSLYLAFQSMESNTLIGHTIKKIYSNHHSELLIFAFVVLVSLRYIGMTSLSLSGWSVVEPVKTESRKTQSGLSINVPALGNQCWNAEIPCASIFNDALRTDKKGAYRVFSVKSE